MLKSFSIAALLITAGSSQAQSIGALPTTRISYADLDLARAAGRAAFAARIRSAIGLLCNADERGTLADQMAARYCMRQASRQANALAAQAIARTQGRDGGERLASR